MSKRRSKYPGLWFRFPNKMVQSEPYKRLTHTDVFVLCEFLGVFHYKKPNSMSVPYSKVEDRISPTAWVNSKFRLCAYGFLYQVQSGGLHGHKPTVMGKCGRWLSLHRKPKNLARVDRLLKHYERIRRIPLFNIKPCTYSKKVWNPQSRKRLALNLIRNRIYEK